MNDAENAAIKAEVLRLNRLITVLLDQNDELKRRIAFSENGNDLAHIRIAISEKVNELQNVGIAISEKVNSLPDAEFAVTEKDNDLAHIRIAVSEKVNELRNIGIAISKKVNGLADTRIAIIEKANDHPYTSIAVTEKGSDLAGTEIAVTEKVIAKTGVFKPLPENIPINSANESKVYNTLKREGYGKVKRTSIRNAARLLLHFHNKGGGSHAELTKLTGLSKDGLGKFIVSLKKRRLIERDGWQKFKPTISGVAILKRAGFGQE